MCFIDEIPIQNMCYLASFIIKPMESGSSVCIKKSNGSCQEASSSLQTV